jgi:hypothetical protein
MNDTALSIFRTPRIAGLTRLTAGATSASRRH